MDEVHIAYRDADRTPLLYVVRDMARRHEDLDVHIDHVPGGEAYEEGFLGGEIDLICEHLRFLFSARRDGHPVRCLASTQNLASERLLVAGHIATLADLAGGQVVIRATPSSRISATHWLKELDLADKVSILALDDEEVGRWQQWRAVVDGRASAVICSPLYAEPALAAGLVDIEAPALPEIGSLFLAALAPFVARNGDLLRRLMRALYRGLYAFRERPEIALPIVAGEPARLMKLTDKESVRRSYDRLRTSYDERPIPTPAAISMTYALLNEGFEPLDGLNPLLLWDLRYLLELEEEGFMDQLRSGQAAI